uniref:Uncharacterized protein n=2 Tax=Salinispora arenicola TaxID=168697 RepID=A8M5Z0_SALAI
MSPARIAVCMVIDSSPGCFAVVEGARVRPRAVTVSSAVRRRTLHRSGQPTDQDADSFTRSGRVAPGHRRGRQP